MVVSLPISGPIDLNGILVAFNSSLTIRWWALLSPLKTDFGNYPVSMTQLIKTLGLMALQWLHLTKK
jgi:hypothetical protein